MTSNERFETMDSILATQWQSPQTLFTLAAVLGYGYSLYCLGWVVLLKRFGRSSLGMLKQPGALAAGRRCEVVYRVDGQEYTLTIKKPFRTIMVGADRFRMRVLRGVIVHYLPGRPHKGYDLTRPIARAVNSTLAATLLLILALLGVKE